MGVYFPKIKQWFVLSRENASKWRLASWILLWVVWITAGLAHVSIYYLSWLKIATYNTLWYELFWNVHTYACALVIIQISIWLYHHGPSIVVKPLNRLGALSFGVYLIHPFFLLFYREHPPQTGVSWLIHLWYAGGFGIALIASWIVVGLAARFVPYAWVLFGNLPKPKLRLVPRLTVRADGCLIDNRPHMILVCLKTLKEAGLPNFRFPARKFTADVSGTSGKVAYQDAKR